MQVGSSKHKLIIAELKSNVVHTQSMNYDVMSNQKQLESVQTLESCEKYSPVRKGVKDIVGIPFTANKANLHRIKLSKKSNQQNSQKLQIVS